MLSDNSFAHLLDFYTDHLCNHVMPFWETRCIDRRHGGLWNIFDQSGRLTSTDKYVWSQARALWTFSALYNHVEEREEWLDIADNLYSFLINHGRDGNGRWAYLLRKDGRIVTGPQSVYVDAFVIYGFTEYARASGNEEAVCLALQAYERTSPLLNDHTTLPTQPHMIPEGLQAHGPLMIFSIVYHELGLLLANPAILQRSLELAETVMTQHLKTDREVLLEFVKPGGEPVDTDAGNTFIPGHAIESMWFFEKIYQYHGMAERVDLTMRTIRWHLEKGWDQEYGGLFLACHQHGGHAQWHRPDSKVWWPHTESFYALLKAYAVTQAPWTLDWYWRVHNYAFKTFPDYDRGDWHQNLDRDGTPIPTVVAGLPVKDPFHLPRALIYSIVALRGIVSDPSSYRACVAKKIFDD